MARGKPQFLTNSLILLCVAIMKQANAGQIKVCAKSAEDNHNKISGADVKCYDDDWNNDDFMASGVTGADGCVILNYTTKNQSRWKCYKWWDNCGGKNPDIFCQISGKCLKPTNTSIKNNWDQRSTAHFTQYVQADANFCNNEEDGWNGCGPSITPDFLTDAIGGATGFESACNTHDVCYDNCYKTRQQCENDFKSDMYALCDNAVLCKFAADLFVGGVTLVGEQSCVSARKGRCTTAQTKSCDIDVNRQDL